MFEKQKSWFVCSQTMIDWSDYSLTSIKCVNTAIKKAEKAPQTLFLLSSTLTGTLFLVVGTLQGPRNSSRVGVSVLYTHWPTGTCSVFKPVCGCKLVYFISTSFTSKIKQRKEANGPTMSSRLCWREGGGWWRTHPVSPSLPADIYST